MKHPDFNAVKYVKVSGSTHHIEALYELLKQRKHGISHRTLPDFEDHSLFVINHPYRAWYLIEADGVCVGSVYVQNDNSISVDYAENYVALLSHTIEFIREDHDPLPGIKSVRASNFFINVAPDNSNLIAELLRCGAKHIQSSFALSP